MPQNDILFCLPNFSGGGAEKVFVTLIKSFCDLRAENLRVLEQQQEFVQTENEKQVKSEPSGFQVELPSSVSCVVLSDEGPLRKQIPQSCSVKNLGCGSAKASLLALSLFFRRERPEIIVSTMGYFNFTIMVALILARHRPSRVIFREANTPSSTIRNMPVAWLGIFFYRFLYQFADQIICNSRQVKFELERLGVDSKKIEVLPNPVNEKFIRDLALLNPELPNFIEKNAPLFVSVGRLTKQKGFDLLIDWFRQMTSNANLLIIGEGEQRMSLESKIRENDLNERVKIIGFQENPFPFLQRADAVLLASRWEGLPNVGLEALSLGKSLIITNGCGGLVDLAKSYNLGKVIVAQSSLEFINAMDKIALERRNNNPSKLADSELPSHLQERKVVDQYLRIIQGQ